MENINFNTYVINMKKDKDRWIKIKKNLNNVGINPIRFNAIDGKKEKHKYKNKYILCDYFCPYSIIGCALSHIEVARLFHDHDPNKYALILEDDAKPNNKNLLNDIKYLINKYKNWDMILLYTFDINESDPQKMASGTAYLLSKQGASKIKEKKAKHHVDIDRRYWGLSIIYEKNLFTHEFDTSRISEPKPKLLSIILDKMDDQKYDKKTTWHLGSKVFRIGNIEINKLTIYVIIFGLSLYILGTDIRIIILMLIIVYIHEILNFLELNN
jgi:GR25 family glycosyltransferase involved in LPS biosynthesis